MKKKKVVPLKKKKPTKNKLLEFKKFIDEKAATINDNMNYGKTNFRIRYLLKQGPQQAPNKKGDVVFAINSSKSYRSAILDVYISAFDMYCDKNIEDNYLIDGLIHEFSHIHTSPVNDLAFSRFATHDEIIEANEELTETIAMYVRENLKNKNKELKLYN